MRAVSLQFKLLCRRINRQYNQNTQKQLQHFATITDSNTNGLWPVGISQRVAKTLQPLPQSATTIPTILTRQYFTESFKTITAPATIIDNNTDRFWPIGISQRVAKKLQPLPQSLTDILTHHRQIYRRLHRWMVHIPMRTTVKLSSRLAQLPMDAANPMRACSDTPLPIDLPTDFEKSRGIFKILVRISKNTDGNYRQNLIPPPKKYYFMCRW